MSSTMRVRGVVVDKSVDVVVNVLVDVTVVVVVVGIVARSVRGARPS